MPALKVENSSILSYLQEAKSASFDLIIMREVLWYILEDLSLVYHQLKLRFPGQYVLVELSFPKDQQYGRDYFIGISDFISKFPFNILETTEVKQSNGDDHGYLMIIAKV